MLQEKHEVESFVKALIRIHNSEKATGEFEIHLRKLLKDYVLFSKNRLPYGEQ